MKCDKCGGPLLGCDDGLCHACACEIRWKDIGKRWELNSSLENWFPFSAEEITQLRDRVVELKGRLADQISLTDAFRASEANFDEACDKLKARIRELEEAMPKPETLRGVAFHLRDAGRYYSELGLPCLDDVADKIEKVMRKEGNE